MERYRNSDQEIAQEYISNMTYDDLIDILVSKIGNSPAEMNRFKVNLSRNLEFLQQIKEEN